MSTPAPTPDKNDHLFEEETKLEESGVGLRLIAIIALVVAVGAGIAYYVVKQQKDLTPAEAGAVLSRILEARPAASIHFHAGRVVPSVDEKPRDPHYRLLEKAGIVKLAPDKKSNAVSVTVTSAGEAEISRLPEFKKWKNPDGTDAYQVPLATRKLAAVSSVTMLNPTTAKVDYTWKWVPNKLGEKFDASGKLVQAFTTWDRSVLIKNYGVDFYGETTRASVNMVRTDKGWKISEE